MSARPAHAVLLLLLLAISVTGFAEVNRELSLFRDTFNDGQRVGPVMIALPGGATSIGDIPHEVHLTPFAIAKDAASNNEFVAFLNAVGDTDASGIGFLVPRAHGCADIERQHHHFQVIAGKEQLPVTGISWSAALAYAAWLSTQTGKYYFLPTEAQWEYAARAGSNTTWPWGNDFDSTLALCNASGEFAAPGPVGSYPPNAYGLNDMVGNVWQWTADCFPPDLRALGVENPSDFHADCKTPGIRGGAAGNPLLQCRPGFRVNYWWRGSPTNLGFRVVRLE
ncbi:formylglycine-generating enzyme family protein [Glaciimonas sp. GG7]